MNNDDMYIKIYINRLEQALLDHVRKQVDSETKIAIYEASIQDLQRKLEESEKAALDNKSVFDQAILGLQSITIERDDLKKTHEEREVEFELICNELKKTKQEKQKVLNEVALLEQKVIDLNRLIDTTRTDADVIRNNYTAVLAELEKTKHEVENGTASIDEKINLKSNDTGWTEGSKK